MQYLLATNALVADSAADAHVHHVLHWKHRPVGAANPRPAGYADDPFGVTAPGDVLLERVVRKKDVIQQ